MCIPICTLYVTMTKPPTVHSDRYENLETIGHDPTVSGPVLFKWNFTEEGEWGTAHSMPLYPSLRPEAEDQAWAHVEFQYEDDDLEPTTVGTWTFNTFCNRTEEVTEVELFTGTWGDREHALALGSVHTVEYLMTKLDERTSR